MLEFAEYGYAGLFIASFLAATVVPFSSEVVFTALVFGGLDAWTCSSALCWQSRQDPVRPCPQGMSAKYCLPYSGVRAGAFPCIYQGLIQNRGTRTPETATGVLFCR